MNVTEQMVEALRKIADSHVPDQPASDGGDEVTYVRRKYAELRQIARLALEAATALSQAEGAQDGREERRVYKGSPEYAGYLHDRFADRSRSTYSFEYDGHRWSYQHTGFDDTGEYDLLWRPIAHSLPAASFQAGAEAMREAAALASEQLVTNIIDHPSDMYDKEGWTQKRQVPRWRDGKDIAFAIRELPIPASSEGR